MIVGRIEGGLGNQMFQYACAFGLAKRTESKLALDISAYYSRRNLNTTSRLFELGIFNLNAPVIGRTATERTLLRAYRALAQQRQFRATEKTFLPYSFEEPSLCYQPTIEALRGNIYLRGYWQSFKYFAHIEKCIRRLFKFPAILDKANASLAERIISEESVAIHVRRGDYARGPSATIHGTCDIEYYESALFEILAHLRKPVLYIFSDDEYWARTAIKYPCAFRVVQHNTGRDSYRDMQLMSLCRNHIIANSTFSWWAAWLSEWPERIVVAPKSWYNDQQLNSQTADLIPRNWIRK